MNPDRIDSIAEFYAHAITIEREAAARYQELADQMAVHNNAPLAALFGRLAAMETEHLAALQGKAAGMHLPRPLPWQYHWALDESPEAPPFDAAHYLMTPRQALELALQSEERARDFFDYIMRSSTVPEVQQLAAELAAEEREHVTIVARALAAEDPPAPGWDGDLDPPRETG